MSKNINQNSFLREDELALKGFRKIGDNVLISRFAQFYGTEQMEIGNNVRIDDFCMLSGRIKIGNFVHISAYNALYGALGITINDFSGISPRCTLFSATDDFSGDYLIGPMIKKEFTNVFGGEIVIKKYCQIGAGCIVLPNITIGEGSVTGAMSLVNESLDEWFIYIGIPAKKLKERKRNLLSYADSINK